MQKVYGTRIIRQQRKNPSHESLQRGHDVKFSEFIDYLVDNAPAGAAHKYQDHWREMYTLCFPCSIEYDAIAKIETFQKDMKHIWNKIAPAKRVDIPSYKIKCSTH